MDATASAGGEPLQIAAIIGFASDELRGTLVFAVGQGGLDTVCKRLSASSDLAADSLGEMANLVAGHLKRKLVDYGLTPTITPPMVVCGITIEVCGNATTQRVAWDQRSTGERMAAWFDFECASGLQLTKAEESDSMADGEALFF